MIKFAEDETQTVAKSRVTPERVTEIRASVARVTEMTETKAKVVTKKRGRPAKTNAMTAAQKQRAYRERAKAAKIIK